jgi:hypothetical protein
MTSGILSTSVKALTALAYMALSTPSALAMDVSAFRTFSAEQTMQPARGNELAIALREAQCEVLAIGDRGPVEMRAGDSGRLLLSSAGDIAYAVCPGDQAVVVLSTAGAYSQLGEERRSISSEIAVTGEPDGEGFAFGQPKTVPDAPLRYAVTWRNEKGRQYAIIRFNTVGEVESKAALMPLARKLDERIP